MEKHSQKRQENKRMESLLDLKNALRDIPDEVLDGMGFGLGEGCEEEIHLVAPETDDTTLGFPEVYDKYPQLQEIDNLVRNIIEVDGKIGSDEDLAEQFWESHVSSKTYKAGALKKVMEEEKVYWECNECKLLHPLENNQKICFCGNDMFSNSTKRRIVRSDVIKKEFGEEMLK